MPDVRSYSGLSQARKAADLLLANGIVARIIEGRDLGYTHSSHTIIIAAATELERAKALLDELDKEELDPEWESQVAPDLTRLPSDVRVPCPACGQQLALTPIAVCPKCGTESDVPELLTRLYGPEFMSACYEAAEPEIPDSVVDAAIVHCPGCQYPLSGLDPVGTCPECGAPYSKRAILRGP